MRTKLLITYLALWAVIGLMLAGKAGAESRPFDPAGESAYAQAASYWGRSPSQCIEVDREYVPPGSLDWAAIGQINVLGRATQPQPSDAPSICNMRIVEGLSPVMLCSVVRHEYGHLLGYSDKDMETLPLCIEGPTSDQIARMQDWSEWRELKDQCRESRGPFRKQCWKKLRKAARHIRARYALDRK